MSKPSPIHATRPAKCAVCQQQLAYQGDLGHEPEVKVAVMLPKWQEAVEVKNLHSQFGVQTYYIHLRCWNALPIQLHDCS